MPRETFFAFSGQFDCRPDSFTELGRIVSDPV